MSNDTKIFGNKSLGDVLEEIHKTTKSKRTKIENVLNKIDGLIRTPEDIIVLAPIMKDYFELLIKNDDSLVKLATIVQRMNSAEAYKKMTSGEFDGVLTDEERDELIEITKQAKSAILGTGIPSIDNPDTDSSKTNVQDDN